MSKAKEKAESKLRQQDMRRMKAFAATPSGALLSAVHESLTTPDKEDWTILVDGEDVRLMCVRERDGTAEGMYIQTTVSGFKTGGPEGSIETAQLDGLGCVTFIMPTDAKERGAFIFLKLLTALAKKKGFNLMTFMGSVPTDEAVQAWDATMLRQSQSLGEA